MVLSRNESGTLVPSMRSQKALSKRRRSVNCFVKNHTKPRNAQDSKLSVRLEDVLNFVHGLAIAADTVMNDCFTVSLGVAAFGHLWHFHIFINDYP
jgi:hypothetical protein